MLTNSTIFLPARLPVGTCLLVAFVGSLPEKTSKSKSSTNSTWVQEHRFEFDEAPTVEAVASQLSRLALKFNDYDKDGRAGGGREDEDSGGLAMSRPVGVALLMAGVDRGDRPVLYHLDPSGECRRKERKKYGRRERVTLGRLAYFCHVARCPRFYLVMQCCSNAGWKRHER